jgi:hypothetical protein
LITLSTVFSLQTPVGFVSHRRRSWDSPFGVFPSQEAHARFRPREPTYRFSLRFFHRQSGGPARKAAIPGFQPPESPWRPNAWLARRPLDTPLGFALLRPTDGNLVRTLTRTPLTRFPEHQAEGPTSACASEYRSAPTWPPPPHHAEARRTDGTALLGFLHRSLP